MPKSKEKKKIRRAGEGTLYQRKDGTWEYRISLGYDDSGKLIRKSFYAKTDKEARDKGIAWQREHNEIKYTISPDTLYGDWLALWLENSKKGTIKATSYHQLELFEKKIPRSLKRKKVGAIAPIEIQSFYNAFVSGGVSKSYADKMFTFIKSSFADAYDNGLCTRNPAAKLSAARIQQAPRDTYTSEEVKSILQHALTYQQDNPRKQSVADGRKLATAVIVLLYTGLRRGELLGLQWGDVKQGVIHVRRGVYLENNRPVVKEYSAKTEKSLREIPLDIFVLNLINALPKTGLFVFGANTGGIMSPRNFSRAYKTFIEHAGVRYLSPHCCRHTFATLLLTADVGIRTVQELLGHENINTTALYTHPDIIAKQTAITGLATLINHDTNHDNKPLQVNVSPCKMANKA